jgi:hypothetical protein
MEQQDQRTGRWARDGGNNSTLSRLIGGMTSSRRLWRPLAITALTIPALLTAIGASADAPANDAFLRTWDRTDRPVASGDVMRTWLWGPEGITGAITETYVDADGGKRIVQYFDKSRMEITDPDGDQSSPWYVTNGLLAKELMTGFMQIGDDAFEERVISRLAVAGDPGDDNAPTYYTLSRLMDAPAYAAGHAIIERLAADGAITTDESLEVHDATAYYYTPETGHRVAKPFWYFMTSTGPVYEDGQIVSDDLFLNPFYATGLPITEAYWTRVKLNGVETDVLVQAFERRVLTYTPSNPPSWQVESGNVGRDYYSWRYGAVHRGNDVVFEFGTGEETLEYRFPVGTPVENSGPTAISAAGDGTFWIADTADARLARFNAKGQRMQTIDLGAAGAVSVLDVDVDPRDGSLWTFWFNLDAGLWKIDHYSAAGELIRRYDLPESLRDDGTLSSSTGLYLTDEGVLFVSGMETRYHLLVDNAGEPVFEERDGWLIDGHSYVFEPGEDFRSRVLRVDDVEILLAADDGDGALETHFLGVGPEVAGRDTFFVAVYSVGGETEVQIDFRLRWHATDGQLIGVASVQELADAYVYVGFPHTVGPDSEIYSLIADEERMRVLKIGFNEI